MIARRRQSAVTKVAPPPAPQREHHVPPWAREKGGYYASQTSYSVKLWLKTVAAGALRIPAFQRPWRWSDEQVLLLLDSLRRGLNVGTMLIWERYGLPAAVARFGEYEVPCAEGRGGLVVDGQQRLAALATAAHSGRFFFDLEAGCFCVGEGGRMRAPAGLLLVRERMLDALDWIETHAAQHGLDPERVQDFLGSAMNLADGWQVQATLLPSAWDLDQVVETYTRLATSGTPITPEEVAHALAFLGGRSEA